MKRILLFLTIFYLSQKIKAQAGGAVVPGGGVVVRDYSPPPTFLRELFRDGTTPKLYPDITGTPFLFDNFLLARVHFFDDRIADSVLIKINIYNNKIHFIGENLEELQISIPVKEIIITDNNPSWHGNIYRTGYSSGGSDFFQVLADGKNVQVLKRIMIKVWETRSLGDQQKKSFQYEDELCFGAENTVYVEAKKCAAVISGLAEKYRAKAQEFVIANNIRCNKEEDMKKFAEYCNSL